MYSLLVVSLSEICRLVAHNVRSGHLIWVIQVLNQPIELHVISHTCQSSVKPSIYLVRLSNQSLVRYWNQPVYTKHPFYSIYILYKYCFDWTILTSVVLGRICLVVQMSELYLCLIMWRCTTFVSKCKPALQSQSFFVSKCKPALQSQWFFVSKCKPALQSQWFFVSKCKPALQSQSFFVSKCKPALQSQSFFVNYGFKYDLLRTCLLFCRLEIKAHYIALQDKHIKVNTHI